MKQFRRKINSIYSEEEERVLVPWQSIRQFFLAPIAAVLARLGVTPDMLSFSSIAFGIGFCLLSPHYFTIPFGLLVASIGCDCRPRVESRLQGTKNARATFTDMFCGHSAPVLTGPGIARR